MTTNQLAYLNLQEQHRANLARESENIRYNDLTTSEARRHNLANEVMEGGKLGESMRHNLVSEQLTHMQQDEVARHNLASETLADRTQTEVQRSNLRNEELKAAANAESERTHRENEAIQHVGNNLAQQRIDTENRRVTGELSARAANLAEETRHNLATEQVSGFQTGAQYIRAISGLIQPLTSLF